MIILTHTWRRHAKVVRQLIWKTFMCASECQYMVSIGASSRFMLTRFRLTTKFKASYCWPFVKGIYWWLVNSAHKREVMWKAFPRQEIITVKNGTSRPLSSASFLAGPRIMRKRLYHGSCIDSRVRVVSAKWRPHCLSFSALTLWGRYKMAPILRTSY